MFVSVTFVAGQATVSRNGGVPGGGGNGPMWTWPLPAAFPLAVSLPPAGLPLISASTVQAPEPFDDQSKSSTPLSPVAELPSAAPGVACWSVAHSGLLL